MFHLSLFRGVCFAAVHPLVERPASQSVSVFSCTAIILFLIIIIVLRPCATPQLKVQDSVWKDEGSTEEEEGCVRERREVHIFGLRFQSVSVCNVPYCRCFHKFQHVSMWIPLAAPCCCAFHWEMQRRGGRKRWRYVTEKKDWWDKLQLERMRKIK